MKKYVSYEVRISNADGFLKEFKAERYNELVYETFEYLEKTRETLFYFTMSAYTKEGNKDTLCAAEDGAGPVTKKNMMNIMMSFDMFSSPVNSTVFDCEVSKVSNSLVLKVTEQCRQMRLEPGDVIRVKMEKINVGDSRDNIEKIFYRKDTVPFDSRMLFVDQPDYLDKFLADYHVKGMIAIDDVTADRLMDRVIDHYFAVRTEDGNVILVSQPSNNEGDEAYAASFADVHGLEYDYINEYSWYRRGETKLIIFWLKGVTLRKG